MFTVAGAGINDLAGNAGSNSASDSWAMDTTAPSVADVVDVVPDPRNSPVGTIDLTFSEPIALSTRFTAADCTLTRDGNAVSLSGLTFESLGGSSYGVEQPDIGNRGRGNLRFHRGRQRR